MKLILIFKRRHPALQARGLGFPLTRTDSGPGSHFPGPQVSPCDMGISADRESPVSSVERDPWRLRQGSYSGGISGSQCAQSSCSLTPWPLYG